MNTLITDDVLAAEAQRLSQDDWRFTPRQLYYAASAAVEKPYVSTAAGQIGCGLLLGVAGVATGIRPVMAGAWLLGLCLLISGLLAHTRDRRRQPSIPVLPLPYSAFLSECVDPARERGEAWCEQMVDTNAVASVIAKRKSPVVVCDRSETAALVVANLRVAQLVVDVAVAGDMEISQRPVIALHDADPQGCALAGRLEATSGRVVTDAGIGPMQVMEKRVAVLEGAPAIIPKEVEQRLSEAEVNWLRSGQRIEIATLSPQEIAQLIRKALP